MNKARIILSALIFVFLAGSGQAKGGENMQLKSPEFKDSQFIPVKFSCEGEDVNPELMIGDISPEAKSLALIVDDPDAPMGTWVHWVVFDIPLIPGIAENSIPGIQGVNSAGGKNYHGPCPPSGVHRYLFKIYALDTVLNLKAGISKEQLEKAMQGHILASAQLLGLYKKSS
ncbi:MAG: YbhB/YbcL family Raf kinase inhibitor-like protein [Candidatus Omnitrophota bacterium]